MKILPLVKGISKDISSSKLRIKQAFTEGYTVASRSAKVYKHNDLHKYMNITRSISSKLIQKSTVNDLPYIGGAIGMAIPIPLLTTVGVALGIIAKYSSKGAALLYNNQYKARVNLNDKKSIDKTLNT